MWQSADITLGVIATSRSIVWSATIPRGAVLVKTAGDHKGKEHASACLAIMPR